MDRSAMSVENPVRMIPGNGSAAFLVRVSIPERVMPGRYELYGQAYSAHLAPEETLGRSGRVVFEVAPAAEPKRRPWWLLAVAVLVVIVLAVVGWLVFRGGSPAPAPSASPSASPSKVVAAPQPTPICSASGGLQGTFSFDADACRQATSGDLFWEQFDSVRRALVPSNGATAVRLGVVDFASVTPDQLAAAPYSGAQIDGSANTQNLAPGTVIAVRTRTGHHAKIRIDAYGYNLTLTVVTYP